MCSFQKPEFNQPQHYFKMPSSFKQPDELPLDSDVMEQRLKNWTHISDENRALYKTMIAVRAFLAYPILSTLCSTIIKELTFEVCLPCCLTLMLFQ